MNDETKAELMKRTREWLQSCVNAATRSGVPEDADLEAFILAHLDGEPARLASAREAAIMEWRAGAADRDELRADCERRIAAAREEAIMEWRAGECPDCGCRLPALGPHTCLATPLDATPLDATPLAERDRLRTWVSTVSEALGAIEPVSDCRVELGADAAASVAASLRARVAALEAERDEVTVTLSTAVMWTVAPELVAANHKRAAQEAFDALERLRARVAELEAFGRKVSAIRDSIVGSQQFNWSEHAYPLVAALDAAGFNGAGYKIASENFGTLLDRLEKAEAERDLARAQVKAARKAIAFGMSMGDSNDLHVVLAAMNGAKPK